MKLLHISDPHFHSDSLSIYPHQIKQPLIDLINKEVSDKSDFYLLLTGDITIQGQKEGYNQATNFFKDVITQTGLNPNNIILCPGNHDISEKSFKNFDAFTYSLRQDQTFTFSESNNNLLFTEKACFLSINSAYYLNHKFGLVDIKNLHDILSEKSDNIAEKETKIAIIHHHFLNVQHEDISLIRNSYEALNVLSNFDFIFHGHQHTRQKYTINGIQIKGTSSPTEGRSLSNIIALYEIGEENSLSFSEFIFSKDEPNNGKMGRFIKYG